MRNFFHGRSFVRSVRCAMAGLRHAVQSEANIRWHAVATVVAVVCGVLFGISRLEWALVALCVGTVVGMECLNTSVERLADRVSEDEDPLIGQAKDLAAGGVLAVSVAAAAVGAIVFLPRVIEMWEASG